MKQKMFTLFAVAILFAATTADSFAQLTKIWETENYPGNVSSLSPKGKLAHAGSHVIDLNNGNIIDTRYSPESFRLTYSGDRYFVSNRQEKTMKVYDRYTKEFIQDVKYIPILNKTITASDDSTVFVFESVTHTLQFWNVYTNELKDSYKIPNTPDIPTYSISGDPAFSHDGRYFGFTMIPNNTPSEHYFMVYDRVAREIIFFQTIPISQYSFVYSFMHTTNQIAYGEVIKLEGDIKTYSYIRIFDLDKRENVRNVRVGEENKEIGNFTIRNDDKFILYKLKNTNNTLSFYNLEQNKVSDFIISPMNSVLIADDNGFVVQGIIAFQFDWTVGVNNTNLIGEVAILYPNPTTNSINLEISEVYFNGIWEITDLTGTKLLKGIIQPSPNFHLDISNLPSATYYLRLTNGKEIKVEKVVKW